MIFTTDPIEPSRLTHGQKYVWHAIECVRGREEAVRQILLGDPAVRHAFYPLTYVHWQVRGKQFQRKKAEVPGYVWARFDRWPDWEYLCQRQLVLRPFTVGDFIVSFHPDSIRRLKGLRTRAELMEEAIRQIKMINAGDTARFVDGPLSGTVVKVDAIVDERVRFKFENGVAGETSQASLEKVAAER